MLQTFLFLQVLQQNKKKRVCTGVYVPQGALELPVLHCSRDALLRLETSFDNAWEHGWRNFKTLMRSRKTKFTSQHASGKHIASHVDLNILSVSRI